MRINTVYNWIKLFIVAALAVLVAGCSHASGVLVPKGLITYQERQLMFDSLALMLIVVLPVIIMSFAFVYRYRQSHRTSEYKPEWSHSVTLESIWWGVPCVIILILGIMTWKWTHKIDPYRKIDFPGKVIVIQAVALPWNWLFIYPDNNVASLNTLVIPVNRQVEFMTTADNVPMSAFFIPQLGSQIFTMAGMRSRLHIVATAKGSFLGMNAQYNGAGFSDMHFQTHVVSEQQYLQWLQQLKQSGKPLSDEQYKQVRKPREKGPIEYFSSVAPDLFKRIIQSYKSSERP